jgi:hypothetical protein
MEQRPLRLGDIVDDYCPRERRLTNHVIVALVGDAIRQTRCTTCDTEHVYKEGRVPRRRKKDETAALYEQVLADAAGVQRVPQRAGEAARAETASTPAADNAANGRLAADSGTPAAPTDDNVVTDATDDSAQQSEPAADQNGHHDHWPAHRRLIRATLPRTENDPPTPRPIPEFTMHQRPPHRGGFRHGHGSGWHGANGNGAGQPRHGGGRQGGRPNGEPNGNVIPGPGSRRSGRHRGGKHRRPR